MASGSDCLASSGSQRSSSEYPWWASLFTGFVIIVVGIVALVFIARTVFSFLIAAPTDLGSAVVGAGSLVFVAVIANIWAKIYERGQQIQQEQRKKKAEIYEGLTAFWFRFYLSDEESDEEPSRTGGPKGTGSRSPLQTMK
jgi:hypothetical protein